MVRIVFLAGFLVLAALRPAGAEGMVSLTFDDGLRGVYAYTFPVLRRLGLPGVAAIIVEQMESDNDDYMRAEEIMELQDAGWEIASHGYSHRRIADIPAFYAQEALPAWREDGATPDMIQAYYAYPQVACVMEGDAELAVAAELDQAAEAPGTYYFDRITGELHVNPLPERDDEAGFALFDRIFGEARDTFPDEGRDGRLPLRVCSYEREMDLSRRRLQALGFDVTTYVVPYNYLTNEVLALGRKYYSQMAAGFEGDGVNHRLDPHHIIRSVVHNGQTAEDLIALVEQKVVGADAWLVLCMHDVGSGLGWEPWSAIELEKFAMWLRNRRIPVVTIREGVARMRQIQDNNPQ
jgi:peptidoglycan/xylan/chitin deacetylase (PgdA/CDA1 family)